MTNIAYALSAAIAAGAILPLAARNVTSFSVNPAANTVAVQFEAGTAGDKHALYYAWSNDGVDKGGQIESWPNVVRIGLIGDDATSMAFELPPPANVLGSYAARAFLAATDKDFDYFIAGVKSSGEATCYVDTGFCPVGGSTIVVVDCLMNSTKGQQSLFACNDGASTSLSFGAYINGSAASGGKWAFHCNNGSGAWNMASALTVSASDRVRVRMDSVPSSPKGSVTVVSTGQTYTKTGSAAHNNTSAVSLYLAARHSSSGATTPSATTFYSCVITNAGVCVRDFRPAVKFGVAGMWDAVNNVFYPSTGTKALTAVGTNLTYAVVDGDTVVASSVAYETVNTDFRTETPYVDSNSVVVLGGATKSGAAPLTLTGNNTWGGAFTVNEGTLVADFGQGVAATDSVVLNGGEYCPYLSNLFLGTLGVVAGAGLVSVAPGATGAGFSAYGHPLTVRLGDDATSTLLATSATHRLTRLVLNDSYATDTLTIDNNIDLGNASITCRVGAATAVVKGSVKSAGGTVTRNGGGTLVLNGLTNSFAALRLDSGSKTVISPAAEGVTNSFSATGYATAFTAADALSMVVSNMNTKLSSSDDLRIGGGRHVFAGGTLDITVPSQKYFRPGYYYKATSPKVYGGVDLVLDGTIVKINGLSLLGNMLTYVDSPVSIIITNDATVTTGYNVWFNNGTIRQYSGKFKITGNGAPMFAVSYNAAATASYYLYGGTLEQSYAAPDNTPVIGGGATAAAAEAYNESGYMYIYGGKATFQARSLHLGYKVTGAKYHRGYLYVRGGELSMPYNGAQLAVGRQGNGTFEVSNGGTATINGSVVALMSSAGGRTANVSVLTNGTLKARQLVSNANVNGTGDTANLVLDGGKMIANTSATAEFMHGFTAASVGVGGVVIDTAGQNLTIAQSFAARDGQFAPTASTAAELAALPAFAKAGAGKLTLTGTNEWLCATCVSNGTLVVGDRALPATTLQLRDGVIDLGGNSFTVANLVGYGIVSNGTLTVTGAVWPGVYESGTLKIDSSATLNLSTLGCCVASDSTCGCLEVTGPLDLSGVTVVGEGMENKNRRGLTLARATAFVGTPTADVSLAGNGISVSSGTLRIGAPGVIISIW